MNESKNLPATVDAAAEFIKKLFILIMIFQFLSCLDGKYSIHMTHDILYRIEECKKMGFDYDVKNCFGQPQIVCVTNIK